MIKYLETYTVRTMSNNRERQFPSLLDAMEHVEGIVGNRSYSRPFAQEETLLYGYGDGSVSHMIQRDFEFELSSA